MKPRLLRKARNPKFKSVPTANPWLMRSRNVGPLALSCRGWLLVGGNSDHVAIERDCPVDGGRFICGNQLIGHLSSAHHTVVTPNIVRFAVQKVDCLHLTRVSDGYEEITHGAYIFDIDHESIRSNFGNMHPVDGF